MVTAPHTRVSRESSQREWKSVPAQWLQEKQDAEAPGQEQREKPASAQKQSRQRIALALQKKESP
jgi:hypothetical protein